MPHPSALRASASSQQLPLSAVRSAAGQPRASRLVAAGIVAALLLGAVLAAAAPAQAARARSAMELRAEARFAVLHNEARQNPAKFGITDHPPAKRIVVAGDIREVSRSWSDTMHQTGDFRHNPSYGKQMCCWRGVAENIVWARQGAHNDDPANVDRFVDSLFRLWVGSPGHRRNLMNGTWDDFAVGVTFSGGRMYATANFRRRDGSPVGPPPADSVESGQRPLAAVPTVQDDTSNPAVRRVSGSDRIRTAVAVTRAAFDRADTVLLARADAYPDALAAAPLAGVHRAPILLVGRSAPVDEAVAAAIRDLGATHVTALGGQGVVGDDVLADVTRRTGARTSRVQGADRWETAARAALAAAPPATPVARVFLVEGANSDPARGWPDALSVSAVAARTKAPVLLALRDGVPAPTLQALSALRPAEVVIVGGEGALGSRVEQEVRALLPQAKVDRWAGADRFATSVAVNERAGLDGSAAVVVTGLGYADALAAGAAAARLGGALLLTHGRDAAGAQPVYDHVAARHRGGSALVVGGSGAVLPAVHNRVVRAVGGAAR